MDANSTLVTVGASAGSVAAIAVVLRGGWRASRRIIRIADAVEELVPNGGGSLRDAVDRIERKLDDHLADHRDGGAGLEREFQR